MFCLLFKKVCFKFLFANFEHNTVQKLLKLLNYLFHYIYSCLLTVFSTHVIDVYLINQLSNIISLYIVLQKYPSSEPLVTGLGPGET